MYVERPNKTSIPIRDNVGSRTETFTFTDVTKQLDASVRMIDGFVGRLMLARNANYRIEVDWLFGAGVDTGYQHCGSQVMGVWVSQSGVPTTTYSSRYNVSFDYGADVLAISVTFDIPTQRPVFTITNFVWGADTVTRLMATVKVMEIIRNTQR